MTYFNELTRAMTWLGEKPDTLFIGQQVAYPGNSLYKTLEGVPMEKRLELPVIEDCQMGMSIGLAMMGKTVVSIFPRMDFLLLAMNQLINHLDKNLYPLKGRVIIRTAIGSTKPLYPGVQHCGDYVEGLKHLLNNTRVIRLERADSIFCIYEASLQWKQCIIVEEADLYGST